MSKWRRFSYRSLGTSPHTTGVTLMTGMLLSYWCLLTVTYHHLSSVCQLPYLSVLTDSYRRLPALLASHERSECTTRPGRVPVFLHIPHRWCAFIDLVRLATKCAHFNCSTHICSRAAEVATIRQLIKKKQYKIERRQCRNYLESQSFRTPSHWLLLGAGGNVRI